MRERPNTDRLAARSTRRRTAPARRVPRVALGGRYTHGTPAGVFLCEPISAPGLPAPRVYDIYIYQWKTGASRWARARPPRFRIGRPASHGARNRRAVRGASRHQRQSASTSWLTTCRLAHGPAAAPAIVPAAGRRAAPSAVRTTRQATGPYTARTARTGRRLSRSAPVAASRSHLLGASTMAIRTAKIAGTRRGCGRQAAIGVRDGRKALRKLPDSTAAKGCLSPQPPS